MASFRRHLVAMIRKRCPGCLTGQVYGADGKINERCPVCGLLFEREQGYFLGAMYISYALATATLGLLTYLVCLVFPALDLGVAVLLAGVLFLPLVPPVTRYSRVIWIHFDRWAWPEQPTPSDGP